MHHSTPHSIHLAAQSQVSSQQVALPAEPARSSRHKSILGTSLLAGLLLSASAWATGPHPLGDQFLVNTYTENRQEEAAVARNGSGEFVAVWQSDGSDNGDDIGFSIQGQRYAPDGKTLGDQFLVNTGTFIEQTQPAVAMDPSGDFVVVWLSDEDFIPPFGYSLFGQRFAADGAKVGSQFRINGPGTRVQGKPSIAIDDQGSFIAAWETDPTENDGTGSNIRARGYTSGGIAFGPAFDVNGFRPGRQHSPHVAVDHLGSFLVVWTSFQSENSDPNSQSIHGQLFDGVGTLLGNQFLVSSNSPGVQDHARAAIRDDGQFVVAWESNIADKSDDDGFSIRSQRFDANAAPLGEAVLVNSYTAGDQRQPDLTMDADGGFIIVWTSFGSDTGDDHQFSVQGQRFHPAGQPQGEQFLVNHFTPHSQYAPAVATDDFGNFVVLWTSQTSEVGDFDHLSVQGQRFCSPFCRDGKIQPWTSGDP